MYYPSVFSHDDIARPFYQARIAEFVAEGLKAGMAPASQDAQKVCVTLIDIQEDFHRGSLTVPGAMDDLARTVDFIYRNADKISSVVVSLDTHSEYQIFYQTWWQYVDTGENVAAWTMISWTPKGAVDQHGRAVQPVIAPKWSYQYLQALKANAQKDLMVWPFHCMEGTQGHALMPALREALAFYAAARKSQVNFLFKGKSPYSEQYSIWGAEVPYPADPSTGLNTPMLDNVGQHDLNYILGQARKHCVFESARQQINYFGNSGLIKKMRFVADCTSPVAGMPQAFEDATDAEMLEWERQGLVYVNSTDPIG